MPSLENNTVTKTELYVPAVTLKTKDNEVLNNLINSMFTRSVLWNEYKSKVETYQQDANNLKRITLDSSFQGVNRLFVLVYYTEEQNEIIHMNRPRRHALPRVIC